MSEIEPEPADPPAVPPLPAPQPIRPSTSSRVLLTAATAAATAALHLEHALVGLAIYAAVLIALVLLDKNDLSLAGAYDQKTIDPAQFSPRNNLGMIISGVGAPIIALAVPAGVFDLPAWVTTGAFGLLSGVSMWISTSTANRRIEREGKRRMRELMRRPGVGEVRRANLELAEKHRRLISALVRCGAVDGIRVRVWLLAKAFPGHSAEEIVAAARELAAAGLVGITTIDAGPDASKFLLELTPKAAATVAALQQGR